LNGINLETDFLINAEELFNDIEPTSIRHWIKSVHSIDLNVNRLQEYRDINKTILDNIENSIRSKYGDEMLTIEVPV
jgi:hypothetical protein